VETLHLTDYSVPHINYIHTTTTSCIHWWQCHWYNSMFSSANMVQSRYHLRYKWTPVCL